MHLSDQATALLSSLVKRAGDVAIAVCLLVLTAPVLLAVAGAIRIVLGSPVFFRQQRAGRHGEPFTLVKFRTMTGDADYRPGADDEQRLTGLGRFLRAMSLDELPELWNVIRGDMSLVGPRPLLLDYLPRYSSEQARRHEVRPGITGWAQIHGRNALSWEEKFRLDVWYVEHRSLALDLKILLRTPRGVLLRDGINQAGHATAEYFRGSTGE